MKTRRRRRRSSVSRADLLGVLLLVAVLVIVLGIGAFYLQARKAHPRLDAETLCPPSGPTGLAVVIIDTTDPLSAIQSGDIKNELQSLRDNLPFGWRLSVYRLETDFQQLPKPEIALCNPGRGKDLSEWTDNPDLVERRWRERFDLPIGRIIDSLTGAGEAERSPIMEMIQAVSVTDLTAPAYRERDRRLIVVSDMLQHSERYSMYTVPLSFDAFRKSPAFQSLRADLRDVGIQVLYVSRANQEKYQGADHREFWEQFLTAEGGRLDRLKRIFGS